MGKWLETLKKQLLSGDAVDIGFRFSVLGKGLGGLAEIIGGLLLLFLTPVRMNSLLTFLSGHLFSERPWQPFGYFLLRFGAHFSTGAQWFGILYLTSHGVIKCLLMLLLWKRKLWAYPLAVISILVFIAYQIVRICTRPTFAMIALTVFDATMIVLTLLEYGRIRRRVSNAKSNG